MSGSGDLEVELHDTITALNENQWNNLVEQSDLGTLFHRYEWLQAVESGLGHDVRHAVVAKKGNPVALLPNVVRELEVPVDAPLLDRVPMRRLISSKPGYGGPLAVTDEATCLGLLLDAVDGTDVDPVQHTIRPSRPATLRYGKQLLGRGYRPTVVTGRFVLDLATDWETILEGMDKKRRNAVRTATDGDYEIREETLDEVDDFYDDYASNLDRVGGEPFPRTFVQALADRLGDRVVVFTVAVDDQDVGRYLYLRDGERSTLHHYFSAIGDSAYFEHDPSERLHAHAIQWALAEGYDQYDLGSTGANFQDSQFRHKARYGGRFVPTVEWERGQAPLRWGAYRFGRELYRRLNYE